MQVILETEDLQKAINYIASKPFAEVYQLIQPLINAKLVEESIVEQESIAKIKE